MSVSHKILAISTPSTAQSDSGIERLVAHLSQVLPKAGEPLNRFVLKSALTVLLQSPPELEQTMSQAMRNEVCSTLLCQTKAALALYDWVNPALVSKLNSSLKAPCLLAAIEAHATITGLMAHGVIDEDEINC